MGFWDETLATGHERVDSVHASILEHMEQVLEAVADEDADQTARLLGELGAKVSRHFEEEERDAPPGLLTREHRECHALFLAELERLRTAFASRGLAPAFPLWMRSRVVNWFRFHVSTHDIPLLRAMGWSSPVGAGPPDAWPAPTPPPAG